MEDNDEPAFPVDAPNGGKFSGMTLRDYFASKYIEGTAKQRPAGIRNWFRWLLGLDYSSCKFKYDMLAEKAYEVADSMLEERQ